MSCLFCKIIKNEIPSPRVYEDSKFICIRDIRPQAKTHLLVIPKDHIESLDAAFPENSTGKTELVGELLKIGTTVARKEGLLPAGFRSVINTGAGGGQTVFHIHLHLLGGGALSEDFG